MSATQVAPTRKRAATARATVPASCHVPGLPLRHFFLFPNLPAELQDLIWSETCFNAPRVLYAFINGTEFFFTRLDEKVPGILHATYGSRDIALQNFTLIQHERLDLTPTTPPPPSTGPRLPRPWGPPPLLLPSAAAASAARRPTSTTSPCRSAGSSCATAA